MDRRSHRVWFVLAFILAYYFVILIGDPGKLSTKITQNFFSMTGSLVATYWLYQGFRKSTRDERILWLFLCIGAGSYFFAEVSWAYYESFLQVNVPFPGVPDVFYLLQIQFFAVALAWFLIKRAKCLNGLKYIFEISIIMIVSTTFYYHFLINELALNPEITGLFFFISLGYPIGDLAVLFLASILYFKYNSFSMKTSIVLIIMGVFLQVISDFFYSYNQAIGSYETGSVIDPLFILALMVIGCSSFYYNPSGKPSGIPTKSPSGAKEIDFIKISVPYISLILLLIVFIYLNNIPLTALTIGLSISIILLIIRQVVTIIKHYRLLASYHHKNQELSIRKQLFKSLYKYNPDAVLSLDLVGKVEAINLSAVNLMGATEDLLVGKSFYSLINQDSVDACKLIFKQAIDGQSKSSEIKILKDDHNLLINLTCIPIVVDEQVKGIYAVGKDITESKKIIDKINYLAFHDLVTGLPNRVLFEQMLNKKIKESISGLAVIYIDMDRFKNLNDLLGHDAGDELLVAVGHRVKSCLKESDVVARQGGDEFTVILSDIQSEEAAIEIVNSIIEMLNVPFIIKGFEFISTPSIGVVFYNHEEGPLGNLSLVRDPVEDDLLVNEFNLAGTLMKKADIAMYEAKRQGKNQYVIYTNQIHENSTRRLMIERDLPFALKNNEFFLQYQPQINIRDEAVVGVEALIRWEHPTLGVLYPGEFIPVAEESELILQVSEWVLGVACEQARRWEEQGYELRVAVNLSAKQFKQADLVEKVSRILSKTRMTPSLLELEITENITLDDLEDVVSKLCQLRSLGVKLAIDDFGTGYSSLSYLSKLPIDTLKIPREFIRELGNNYTYEAIVLSVINIAHNLNLTTVAEGVETKTQLQQISNMNCPIIQGFLYSPPLTIEDLDRCLAHPELFGVRQVHLAQGNMSEVVV